MFVLPRAGETVLVTDRGWVIAEITPPRSGRSPYLADAFLADAIREGWITPPANPSREPPPRKPVMKFEELMRELDWSREDCDLPE
jgi:antitoxin (DNA-binding transcriptional repressor) of toxin-antitoxin stability system